MPKLTLFFNNKPIDVFHLEENESTVGRDLSNTFTIDSLAIAPTHLKVTYVADEFFIENLSEQFPTLLNDQPLVRETMHQGDKIQLGKHTLFYSDTPDFSLATAYDEGAVPDRSQKSNPVSTIGSANLQIMNGPDIGLVIALNKAVTEITIGDKTAAIIAKRHDGYYISRLSDTVEISMGHSIICDETKLRNNSTVQIDSNKYIFFIE